MDSLKEKVIAKIRTMLKDYNYVFTEDVNETDISSRHEITGILEAFGNKRNTPENLSDIAVQLILNFKQETPRFFCVEFVDTFNNTIMSNYTDTDDSLFLLEFESLLRHSGNPF